MLVNRAYKFRMYPNIKQKELISKIKKRKKEVRQRLSEIWPVEE